ncbi:hypothetical protein VULLAG_LOCUS14970 [Vulpes lagopus]
MRGPYHSSGSERTPPQPRRVEELPKTAPTAESARSPRPPGPEVNFSLHAKPPRADPSNAFT